MGALWYRNSRRIQGPATRVRLVVVSGTVGLLAVALCNAQAQPQFEVASIRPSADTGITGSRGGPGTSNPERFSAGRTALSDLIRWAYEVKSYQFEAPKWTESARFDLEAKLATGTSREEFRLMLQRLLAERFKLRVHQEKRTGDVYELAISKKGSKLKAAQSPAPSDAPTPEKRYPGSFTIAQPNRAMVRAVNEPISYLISQLSSAFDLPILDSTGLKGRYDFELSWAPNTLDANQETSSLPTLFDALPEQLGLRLTRTKGQIDVLLVDHVERVPSAN